ncbi:MAG: DUF5908 family protein [Bacteroidetes bacterium]|nr:DUF5908 family protein [Bacteroidota bacterium]
MPVEIRELIIKTEIVSGKKTDANHISAQTLAALRRQLLAECKRMLAEENKKKQYHR